jgi:hypothetical protein
VLFFIVLATAAAAAHAQQFNRMRMAVREGVPDQRGGFTFCRLMYRSVRTEAGGQGWSTDYPAGDHNFMYRLEEMTEADVSRWRDGERGYGVVRATSPELFQCPFLFASDVGTAGFDPDEVVQLREYLLKGGTLWADDFWGDRAWEQWSAEILNILPEYSIVDVPLTHPVFTSSYSVPRIPQVPSIRFWRSSGGGTSERGAESAEPHFRGIFNEHGRLLVLMSHNTDIADGWEREGEDHAFFERFSPDAYAVGINVALYLMTH